MPRKTPLQPNLTELLAAVTSEHPEATERAHLPETPSTIERASISERTTNAERARPFESTEADKRAIPPERTQEPERATGDKRTVLGKRADTAERTTQGERASTTENPKPPERFTFTNRVRITDGFQYRGNFQRVPDWADRNWLQYDASPPKPYPPGPALFLPDGQIVRVTDWLVSEHIAEGDGSPLHTSRSGRLVVYSDKDMQHFFSVTPQ